MLKARIRNFLGRRLGFYKSFVPDGFSAINQRLPEDVFIVAYPKSGVTWFQNLVCGLAYGLDSGMSPPWLVNDLVPDIHITRFYRRYATPMYFKSHCLPRPEYRRVVYLLRDGRDVMVSFKHYEETLKRKTLDFLQFVTCEESLFPCKWHRHVEEWSKNPFKAEMLVIKYEDLLEQPVPQLERFCEFVNLSRKRDEISEIVEEAQFQHLHDKEDKFRCDRLEKWPAGKFFFRRGVVGSHKDEMPPEVLQAFLSDASETLRRHGYPVGTAVPAGVAMAAAGR
ncbi:MAG TPA: sulfotransferase domain-containing protein [Verrucomicrobiae bacterium]|nr:sulfotransferase domain-containing protein [Verrucomicrobiae bacterium]